MSGKSNCSVYIGNLDERVGDRVLYDILIQAGRVVDLHIPRDKETGKAKGYAFAEYESEEIAEYAVKLFSGFVTLYKRTLKFAISGQDKPSANTPNATTPPTVSSSDKRRQYDSSYDDAELFTQYNRYRSYHDSTGRSYSRGALGATFNNVSHTRSGYYDEMRHR